MDLPLDLTRGRWPKEEEKKQNLMHCILDLPRTLFPTHKGSFRIVTWNVGTTRDYSNMRRIRHSLAEGLNITQAYQKLLSRPYRPVEECEMQLRIPMIQQTIEALSSTDLICMQESWQIENFCAIFPKNFGYYSYANSSGREGVIAWNRKVFRFLKCADICYDQNYVPTFDTAPDTIILLEHRTTKATICVTSAHLRGFALTDERLSEHQKLVQARKAHAGDSQVCYNRDTMALSCADLCIFAGDYNVTPEHYPKRLQILEDNGYKRDQGDTRPTIYDATLREKDGITPLPVKLDYIHMLSNERVNSQIIGFDPLDKPIEDFENRPSDHMPVAATIHFSLV